MRDKIAFKNTKIEKISIGGIFYDHTRVESSHSHKQKSENIANVFEIHRQTTEKTLATLLNMYLPVPISPLLSESWSQYVTREVEGFELMKDLGFKTLNYQVIPGILYSETHRLFKTDVLLVENFDESCKNTKFISNKESSHLKDVGLHKSVFERIWDQAHNKQFVQSIFEKLAQEYAMQLLLNFEYNIPMNENMNYSFFTDLIVGFECADNPQTPPKARRFINNNYERAMQTILVTPGQSITAAHLKRLLGSLSPHLAEAVVGLCTNAGSNSINVLIDSFKAAFDDAFANNALQEAIKLKSQFLHKIATKGFSDLTVYSNWLKSFIATKDIALVKKCWAHRPKGLTIAQFKKQYVKFDDEVTLDFLEQFDFNQFPQVAEVKETQTAFPSSAPILPPAMEKVTIPIALPKLSEAENSRLLEQIINCGTDALFSQLFDALGTKNYEEFLRLIASSKNQPLIDIIKQTQLGPFLDLNPVQSECKQSTGLIANSVFTERPPMDPMLNQLIKEIEEVSIKGKQAEAFLAVKKAILDRDYAAAIYTVIAMVHEPLLQILLDHKQDLKMSFSMEKALQALNFTSESIDPAKRDILHLLTGMHQKANNSPSEAPPPPYSEAEVVVKLPG